MKLTTIGKLLGCATALFWSCILIAPASATIIAADDFSTDGALVGSTPDVGAAWAAHSGAGNKPIMVSGGQAVVVQSAGSGEDDNVDWQGNFRPLEAGDTIYAAFDLTVTGTTPVDTTYFAHFKTDGTFYNSRVGIAPAAVGAAGGDFQLWLSGDGADDGDGEAFWPTNLAFGTTYRVVHSYDYDTGSKSMWVDPVNQASTSVTATDNLFSDPMVGFALRQNTGGNDTSLMIDNLCVATDFTQALTCVPEPATAALVSLATLAAAGLVRRRS